MIIADTSVWIGHFRKLDEVFDQHLREDKIAMHPFVAGELALGSLRNRKQTLADFKLLPQMPVAGSDEIMYMIESHKLYSRGIGLIDAHLIATCLVFPGTLLWTRDLRLGAVAESLGIRANLP